MRFISVFLLLLVGCTPIQEGYNEPEPSLKPSEIKQMGRKAQILGISAEANPFQGYSEAGGKWLDGYMEQLEESKK